MTDFCQLWLTCADKNEADKIGKTVLNKKLIACYGVLPSFVGGYWWHGKIEKASEVWLSMLSRLDLFDEVEKEVTKFHSYDTFVLEATPIYKVSQEATRWLKKEITHV